MIKIGDLVKNMVKEDNVEALTEGKVIDIKHWSFYLNNGFGEKTFYCVDIGKNIIKQFSEWNLCLVKDLIEQEKFNKKYLAEKK